MRRTLAVVFTVMAAALAQVLVAPPAPITASPIDIVDGSLPTPAPLGSTRTAVVAPSLVASLARRFPIGPQQVVDVSRLFSESFEASPFPPRGSNWTISDQCTSLPGQNDVISWGQQSAEFTVGAAGLWSVGGGRLGSTLSAADKDYPISRSGIQLCPGINTVLLSGPLDFSAVPNGMRVTFDYKAKMPPEALFIGAGNLDKPNADGSITLEGPAAGSYVADTGGHWTRGVHLELGAYTSRVRRVILGFIYRDPPPAGAGPISTGNYGLFIDNVHVDALFGANAPYIPSPTPTGQGCDAPDALCYRVYLPATRRMDVSGMSSGTSVFGMSRP